MFDHAPHDDTAKTPPSINKGKLNSFNRRRTWNTFASLTETEEGEESLTKAVEKKPKHEVKALDGTKNGDEEKKIEVDEKKIPGADETGDKNGGGEKMNMQVDEGEKKNDGTHKRNDEDLHNKSETSTDEPDEGNTDTEETEDEDEDEHKNEDKMNWKMEWLVAMIYTFQGVNESINMTLGDLLGLLYKPTQTMMSIILKLTIRDFVKTSPSYDFYVAYEKERASPMKSRFEDDRSAVYIGALNSA